MILMNRRNALASMCAGLLAQRSLAQSRAWPQMTVKIVVPYPPGGQSDVVARYIASYLTPTLGQPCIVENRPGAQGIIGSASVARGEGDGHTILYGNVSTMAINPHAYATLPYRPTDLIPVVQLGTNALCLVINSSLPFHNLAQFLANVRAERNKYAFASNGLGSAGHLYGEMLKQLASIDMLHVPYQGGGPATKAVLSGEVQAGIGDFGTYGPHLLAGKLRALAVTGTMRWPAFAEVPTFSELGYPLDMAGWNGLFMHTNTPAETVSVVHNLVSRAISSEEGRSRLLAFGLEATSLSQTQFAETVSRDQGRWGQVIRKAGLRLER